MVRVCPIVTAIAGAVSVARALPAQVVSQKGSEAETEYKAQLKSIATALQQLADTPSTPIAAAPVSNINKNAAYVGAAAGAAVGALIGGTVGAYMPANTTFSISSIIQGLTVELAQVNSAAAAMKEDGGLSILTKLIPKLGSLMAQQPNLGRGPKEQEGPYKPPPPPANLPWENSKAGDKEKPADVSIVPLPGGVMEMSMGKPQLIEAGSTPGSSTVPIPGGVMQMGMPKSAEGAKSADSGSSIVPMTGGVKEMGMPKSAEGAKSAESQPKGAGMTGMEIAPPPSPGPPKPVPLSDAKTPSAPPATALPKDSSTSAFPGLESTAAAPVAAPVAKSESKTPGVPPVPEAPKDTSTFTFPGLDGAVGPIVTLKPENSTVPLVSDTPKDSLPGTSPGVEITQPVVAPVVAPVGMLESKNSSVPLVPNTPKDSSTEILPGMESTQPAVAPNAAPAVEPTITGLDGMGGHGHSGERRR